MIEMGYLDPDSTTESEMQMLANFKKEKYWNLLLHYEAFANIPHVLYANLKIIIDPTISGKISFRVSCYPFFLYLCSINYSRVCAH